MKKVIATFGVGPSASLLEVSLPTFAKYASAHGYDLFVPSQDQVRRCGRAPPWGKLPLVISLLRGGYEAVLWIDADVVVVNHEKDILGDLRDGAPLGLVVQETEDGAVPSTGVMLATRAAEDTLKGLWPMNGFRRSGCWWEQAALIAALGGDPDAEKVCVPEGDLWAELPYEWNPHVRDRRGVSGCRFFHATMFPDRRAAMLEAIR